MPIPHRRTPFASTARGLTLTPTLTEMGLGPFALLARALSLLVLCTLDFDSQTQARYLIAAYNLAVVSPHCFEQLLSLEGEGSVNDKIHLVHTFLSEAIRSWQLECQELPSWSVEFVASLIAKDQRNGFGLSTFVPDTRLRKIRAYAIYAQASFFNHDCLPNACRFDYIDKPGVGNTDIIIRCLHDIAEDVIAAKLRKVGVMKKMEKKGMKFL
ncbi:hypothetical protein GOP47_0019711 [Adiantum capillus-veneris]|uniref:SET domain-containing protein n=1 Tax=Adiantum capillus-veneris TaxID=13818 RepID=A0A9D4UBL4_ADICA|nr:hypothetical protein GOP47_0019711 [Adiantum capillus-veneris]